MPFNINFTRIEIPCHGTRGKTISFTGSSIEWRYVPKNLAYYEPKLNDIRTKSAVTANMYVLAQIWLLRSGRQSETKGKKWRSQLRKTQKKGPLNHIWFDGNAKTNVFLYKNLDKKLCFWIKRPRRTKHCWLKKKKSKKQPKNAISM